MNNSDIGLIQLRLIFKYGFNSKKDREQQFIAKRIITTHSSFIKSIKLDNGYDYKPKTLSKVTSFQVASIYQLCRIYYRIKSLKFIENEDFRHGSSLLTFKHLSSLNNLEYLTFDYEFNGKLYYFDQNGNRVPYLPARLKSVIFGRDFNQDLDDHNHLTPKSYLPPNLEVLILGYDFNQPISILPSKLKEINLGGNFNQNLYYNNKPILPLHLKKLIFGDYFQCPLYYEDQSNKRYSLLPPSLETLIFGYHFNEPINLLVNKFDCYCNNNHRLTWIIPSSVINLTFGFSFDQDIFGILDSRVKKNIHNSNRYKRSSNSIRFEDGRKLSLNKRYSVLPLRLNNLIFGYFFNRIVFDSNGNSFLPGNLSKLIFGNKFNREINHITPSLTKLVLGEDYNHSLNLLIKRSTDKFDFLNPKLLDSFSNSKLLNIHQRRLNLTFNRSDLNLYNIFPHLSSLTFGNNFNSDLEIVLPETLTSLTFGSNFDKSLMVKTKSSLFNSNKSLVNIKSCLPSSLKHLKFGFNYNQSLFYLDQNQEYQLILPPNLLSLETNYSFNQPLNFIDSKGNRISVLPNDLLFLKLKEQFNQPLGFQGQSFLPTSLRYLAIIGVFNQTIQYRSNKKRTISYLPSTIERVYFNCNINNKGTLVFNFPYLTDLIFSDNFNNSLSLNLPQLRNLIVDNQEFGTKLFFEDCPLLSDLNLGQGHFKKINSLLLQLESFSQEDIRQTVEETILTPSLIDRFRSKRLKIIIGGKII